MMGSMPCVCARIARTGAALALLLGGAPGVLAAGNSLWDTTRVLDHHGNECAGQEANTCRTVASESFAIAGNATNQIKLTCPALFPHLVGWDTQQHEFLQVALVSPNPDQVKKFRRKPETLVVDVTSSTDTVGNVQIFAGCAKSAPNRTPFMAVRIGLPGNHVGFEGGGP